MLGSDTAVPTGSVGVDELAVGSSFPSGVDHRVEGVTTEKATRPAVTLARAGVLTLVDNAVHCFVAGANPLHVSARRKATRATDRDKYMNADRPKFFKLMVVVVVVPLGGRRGGGKAGVGWGGEAAVVVVVVVVGLVVKDAVFGIFPS